MGLFDTGYDLGSGLGQTMADFGPVDPFATATPDYSTAVPSSALDGGSDWTSLFKDSVSKGLDYFIAKDAYQTKAALPQSYPGTYYRGADGRLYQSNGAPVGGVGLPASSGGNGNLMLLLLAGAVALVLLKRG